VVDDQVGRDQRVDPGGVAAEVRHRVAHHGKVDDRGDAGEVLEDHARGHERDLGLGRHPRNPGCECGDILGSDDPATGMPQQVLEEDLDRDRCPGEVKAAAGRVQPIHGKAVVTDGERGAGAKGIDRGLPGCHRGHASFVIRALRGLSRRRTGAPVPGRDRRRV
jgi:hypothetical protein